MTTYKIAADAEWRPDIVLCTNHSSDTVSISVANGCTQTVFTISRAAFAQLGEIANTINQETT